MGLYTAIYEQLSNNRSVTLARIIHRVGSGPRSVGAACAVLESGQLLDTIGGGMLEYQVHQVALQVLQHQRSTLYALEMNGEDVSDSRMICGGKVEVYLEPLLASNKETVRVFQLLSVMEQVGKPGVFLTHVVSDTPGTESGRHGVIMADGEMIGNMKLPDVLESPRRDGDPQLVTINGSGGGRFFISPVQQRNQVILFGGGHISTCLSPLLKPLAFSTTVVDDRKAYANYNSFPEAEQVLAIPFKQSFVRLQLNRYSYIVIVTRGHSHDAEVLSECLRYPVAYIGMIGSRRKRDTIYRELLEEGVSQSQLDAVYSPIGVDILSETPEEVALSIAAELVRVRAERRRKVRMNR